MFGWFKSKETKMREAALEMLDTTHYALSLGISARLRKYAPQGADDTKRDLFSVAVLNELAGYAPTNRAGAAYLSENWPMIQGFAGRVKNDAVLAQAVSYLYALQALTLAIKTGNPVSADSMNILERANKFGLHIPSTVEICGSDRAEVCIMALHKYAQDFFTSALSAA